MAKGYKVRIADGSEIGPMTLEAVKSWYAQGLIHKDSPVLRPGAKRWEPLSAAVSFKDLGGPSGRSQAGQKGGRSSGAGSDTETDSVSIDLSNWRLVTAGILFFLGAGVAAFWAFSPDRWLPVLDGTPWKDLALGQLALGLCVIRGWELGRKLVRAVVFLLSFALLPLAGILLFQGVRGRPLLVLLSAWVLAWGFFALLGPDFSHVKGALSLVTVLGAWYGIIHFGLYAETSDQVKIRDAVSPELHYSDPSLDLVLSPPKDWRILKKDQQLVAVPREAKVVLARPRRGGFAFLLAEPSPKGVFSLDEYLNDFVQRRRKSIPLLTELERSIFTVHRLSGRRVLGSWELQGDRYKDLMAVWKDGRVYFGLAAWVPEDSSAKHELEALLDGAASSGTMEARLQQAIQAATAEVPYLSALSAEMLMGQSQAEVLEPQEVFRRSYRWASMGVTALDAKEGRELGDLTSMIFANVSRKDRPRLTAYLDRVRGTLPTSPDEDREMARVMKSAVLMLSADRLARLQALYERSIRAAILRGSA